IHRFPFTFIIPNSYIDTIDDEFAKVRHIVEAVVTRTGKTILNQYRISKPVLILRTYMCNSLLVNNSIQDLSQTFEKHFTTGDIEIMVEAAAFSSGDIFYLNIIVQPQRKHGRLEYIGCHVTESRRYSVSEMGAWRTDSETFPLYFAHATPLSTFMGSSSSSTASPSTFSAEDMDQIFDKQKPGVELTDVFAYRVGFATPTCKENFHHTSYYNEILFRHRLHIHITLSYSDEEKQHNTTTTLINDNNNTSDYFTEGSSSSSNTTTPSSPSWQTVLSKLRKGKLNNGKNNSNNNEEEEGRIYEKMDVETPMTIFDCRLKEDYGHLPSYFETGTVKPSFTTTMPMDLLSTAKEKELQANSNNNDGEDQQQQLDYHKKKKKEEDKKPSSKSKSKSSIPYAYLCECYYEFCQLMEINTKNNHETTIISDDASLQKIPSIPPPDYID
ncbi:hypothetical protein BJ944DRAFT_44749, partial [Cunninghamella echinulata]